MKTVVQVVLSAFAAALVTSGAATAAELKIGLAAQVSSIDPHYHNLGPNNAVARHLFDRLVHMDEKQRLTPGLAVSWKPLNDTTWEFKLRQGVRWHDGSPFTADDVVFTFERAPNVPQSPSSFGIYIKGKTVRKVDDHTIHVTTEKPYPLMPNDLSTFSIVSRKHGQGAATEDYNAGKATIGTGPYRFAEWVAGDWLVLQPNPRSWEGKPAWDKVTLKLIPSGPARVAALLAGDVDLIEDVPTADIARLKNDPNIAIFQGVSNRVIYLHLDHQRDSSPFVRARAGNRLSKNPLRDPRVRKALSKAINRPAIVERIMEGVAIPAGQLLPEGFFGVSPALKAEPYDPEGAKKLLAEAGYPNGFGLTLHGPNGRYTNDVKIAEAVAQFLTRIGIDTRVETMPPSVFFSRGSKLEFSFMLVGWGSGTGEASSPLKSLLHTYDQARGFGASNRGRYSNPEVDQLLEQALATVDDPKREKLLQRATEVAIGDLGIIPLHYQVNTWAARKGLSMTPRADEETLAMGVVRR